MSQRSLPVFPVSDALSTVSSGGVQQAVDLLQF